MSKYNFDEEVDRRHTFSDKWDLIDDPRLLPLWVADMDFKAAPAILSAVRKAADQGVFGYALPNQVYFKAIADFHKRHYGAQVNEELIIPTPCVLSGLTASLQAVARPGQKVILMTPAYNNFFSSITNSGLIPFENPLRYENGGFSIDFDLLEQQAADEKARVLLLCNPHNPTGRMWTEEELIRVLDIAGKHGLIVISDEIHCNIHHKKYHFHTLTTISSENKCRIITLNSPSKTFNVAGLKNAYIICPDQELYKQINRQVNINEVCDVNVFGIVGTIAAYTECDDWMDELNEYIYNNYTVLCDFFSREFPAIKVAPLECTYLAWVDCSPLKMSDQKIKEKLLKEGKVLINEGSLYRSPQPGFIRINMGCRLSTLQSALERFRQVFKH